MPTNQEWLHKLANESPDELKAWFDAEHFECPSDAGEAAIMSVDAFIAEHADETACVTKTPDLVDVEGVDSREKLEADVREWVDDIGWLSDKETQVADFIAWLDRQDRITHLECMESCNSCVYRVEYNESAEEVDRLQRRNDELRTSYDKLKRERDNLADDLLTCNREREHLRKNLGIALDHAHDICALVDIGD